MATPVPPRPTTGYGKKRPAARGKAPATKIKMTKEERRSKYTQIARDRKDKAVTRHREGDMICYNCRKTGHSIHNCPDATDAIKNYSKKGGGKNSSSSSSADTGSRICYACGSTEHGLANCPNKHKNSKTDGELPDLPFATCFVCQGQGHLASQCPQNEKGVYVNGGACSHCQSVRHLATACPTQQKAERSREDEAKAVPNVNVKDLLEGGYGSDSDHDNDNKGDDNGTGANQAKAVTAKAAQKKPKRRVVNF
jgi:zinc finger CCHC domain-containing protein 9